MGNGELGWWWDGLVMDSSGGRSYWWQWVTVGGGGGMNGWVVGGKCRDGSL